MDVNRVSNYQAPPPPPTTGAGQGVDVSAPAPVQSASPAPAPAPVYDAAAPVEGNTGGPDPLRRAVSEINSSLAAHGRHLSIHLHEATGRRVVTVYNSDTNEVLREIPPDRVLDAHANVLEMAGLLVDTRG